MDHSEIIEKLEANHDVFKHILSTKTEQEYMWKLDPTRWCLLEIICHLYDEEREDFRARVKHTLESPEMPLPMFEPIAWVTDRKYMEQDYNTMLQKFLAERITSVEWLNTLKNPSWENAYNHPKLGPLSSEHFLANWLAHDYLHIRQMQKVQYQYLRFVAGDDLSYAGDL